MRTLASLVHLLEKTSPLLAEELSAFSVLDKPDIGMWVVSDGDEDVTRFYLFNIDRMDAYLNLMKRRLGPDGLAGDLKAGGSDEPEEYGLAAFSFSSAAEVGDGPCLNGNIIQTASAVKGYGPAMYELIMARGILMPDRRSVSASARHVWKRFQDRSDVESTALDDKDDPQTIPYFDDCKVYKTNAVLDRGYEFRSPSDTARLQQLTYELQMRGDAVVKKYGVRLTDEIIERHARAFFRLLYRRV